MTELASGLRERKKEQTRAAIKAEALRLFRRDGYANTTVEQIAAAAEISPSTFFRYFPTKESVVIVDEYQVQMVRALHAQPAELSPARAMHRAACEVFGAVPAADLAALRDRNALVMATPELRGPYLDHLVHLMEMIAASVAVREGLDRGDFRVRTFAWVMQGVLSAAAIHWLEDRDAELLASFDRVFEFLDDGLKL